MQRRRFLEIGAPIVIGMLAGRGASAAGSLRVGAALPDPPFEFTGKDGKPAGFDVELMQRVCSRIGREWQLVRYTGADFNGIFAGLGEGKYDCVASGTTITPGRQAIADFCEPYAISGQSLVVDKTRHPNVRSIDDLKGLVVGVQQGNTSQPVADKLVAEGRAARVRVYAYDEIEKALGDLSTGGCDAFMKLAPVMHWFVRDRPRLAVVQTGITREVLGVCVRKGDKMLREALNGALSGLARDGTVGGLIKEWLGDGATAPS